MSNHDEDDNTDGVELEDGDSDCVLAVVMMRQTVGIAIYDGLHSAIYSTQLTALTTIGERLEVHKIDP